MRRFGRRLRASCRNVDDHGEGQSGGQGGHERHQRGSPTGLDGDRQQGNGQRQGPRALFMGDVNGRPAVAAQQRRYGQARLGQRHHDQTPSGDHAGRGGLRAPPARAPPSRAPSARATSSRAPSARATSSRAPSARATSARATSGCTPGTSARAWGGSGPSHCAPPPRSRRPARVTRRPRIRPRGRPTSGRYGGGLGRGPSPGAHRRPPVEPSPAPPTRRPPRA